MAPRAPPALRPTDRRCAAPLRGAPAHHGLRLPSRRRRARRELRHRRHHLGGATPRRPALLHARRHRVLQRAADGSAGPFEASATTRRGCSRATASRCSTAPARARGAGCSRRSTTVRCTGPAPRSSSARVCTCSSPRLFLDHPFGTPGRRRGRGVRSSVAAARARSRRSRSRPQRVFGIGAVYDGGYIYTYASQRRTCAFCFAGDMYVAACARAGSRCRARGGTGRARAGCADPNAAPPVLHAAVSNTDVQRYGNGFLLVTKP